VTLLQFKTIWLG